MSEWWTYSLQDFLLFSPRTYYRMFALYNEALWPAHIATAALGALCLTLARRGGPLGTRAVLAVIAALWLWIAWGFHVERFATINWAAIYYAYAFAVQGALLLWFALVTPPDGVRATSPIAFAVALFAVLLHPLIGTFFGRDWHQAEVFGLAPDPTALATLAFIAMHARPPRLLLIIPALWCAMTGLTLWTMESSDALITPIAGAVALLAAAWKTAPYEARRN